MGKNRIAALCAGVVVLLFAGVIYAWSILKSPFLTEFGWSQGALGTGFTVLLCCFAGGNTLGGALLKRIRPCVALRIGAALSFAGFFLASRLSGESVLAMYMSYSVMCGLGIGIVYNTVISSVSRRFSGKGTAASGVMMMGFGASTLILGSVAGHLMRTVWAGPGEWRGVFVLFAALMGAVFLIGSFFMPDIEAEASPEGADVKDAKAAAAAASDGAGADAASETLDIATKDMVRLSSFWKFYAYQALLCGVGTGVISIVRDTSLSVGNAEPAAVAIVGVVSICNGIGRIASGAQFDMGHAASGLGRIAGRKATILTPALLCSIATAVCIVSVLAGSAPLNTAALVVIGFTYGYMPTLSSGFARSMYGSRHFPVNFSIVSSMLVVASFAAAAAGGLIVSTGSYAAVFAMLLCFALASLALVFAMRKQI